MCMMFLENPFLQVYYSMRYASLFYEKFIFWDCWRCVSHAYIVYGYIRQHCILNTFIAKEILI